MTPFQTILFVVFAIIVYMMCVDENVTNYINLISKIVKTEIDKKLWIIKYHPKNPITNLIKRREYDKIAIELMNELNSKSKENQE